MEWFVVVVTLGTVSASTCVIGAGPVGLATALWLTDDGQNVTVFEQSDRIGGRVQAWRDPDGNVHEVGAILSCAEYTLTDQLMRRFAVEPLSWFGYFVFKLDVLKFNAWAFCEIVANGWSNAFCAACGYDGSTLKQMERGYPLTKRTCGLSWRTAAWSQLTARIAAALPSIRINTQIQSLEALKPNCDVIVVTGSSSAIVDRPTVFDALKTTPYWSAVVECAARPHVNDAYVSELLVTNQHGNRYLTVYGYVYGNEPTTQARMRTKLGQTFGCEVVDVPFWKVWWEYFPRFDDEWARDEVERLQGLDGVYWVGAYMSFDAIEPSLRYAKRVFDQSLASCTG